MGNGKIDISGYAEFVFLGGFWYFFFFLFFSLFWDDCEHCDAILMINYFKKRNFKKCIKWKNRHIRLCRICIFGRVLVFLFFLVLFPFLGMIVNTVMHNP